MHPIWHLRSVIEGSVQHRWYRQTAPHSGASDHLGCDCERWTRDRNRVRSCQHTRLAQAWQNGDMSQATQMGSVSTEVFLAMQPLLQDIRGDWQLRDYLWQHEELEYRVAEVTVVVDNIAHSSFVALGANFHPTAQDVAAGVARWAGYSLAQSLACANGYLHMTLPPTGHFNLRSELQRLEDQRLAAEEVERRQRQARWDERQAEYNPLLPRIYTDPLLALADRKDLGDGKTPEQRSEEQLALFLGALYPSLIKQGFLDVSSKQTLGRVYRLVIDPERRIDRRVMVFEQGRYTNDMCIVRMNRAVPVQDGFLRLYMGLLVNEQGIRDILSPYNYFKPFSDSRNKQQRQHEMPAVWHARQPTL